MAHTMPATASQPARPSVAYDHYAIIHVQCIMYDHRYAVYIIYGTTSAFTVSLNSNPTTDMSFSFIHDIVVLLPYSWTC